MHLSIPQATSSTKLVDVTQNPELIFIFKAKLSATITTEWHGFPGERSNVLQFKEVLTCYISDIFKSY